MINEDPTLLNPSEIVSATRHRVEYLDSDTSTPITGAQKKLEKFNEQLSALEVSRQVAVEVKRVCLALTVGLLVLGYIWLT